MKTRLYMKLGILLIAVPALIIACGDDPASGGLDPDDIPQPPDFGDLEMDLSVFQEGPAQSATVQSVENYTYASNMALAVQNTLTGLAALPNAYFQQEMWGEPDLSGSDYTWEYDYGFGGESMGFTVTASEQPGGFYEWQLRFSMQSGEESINNALLMEALVSADGQEGSWEIFDLEDPDRSLARLTYEKEGDVPVNISIIESEDQSSEITYVMDEPTGTITFTDGSQIHTEITWNTDTGTGSVSSGDGTMCWDENFDDTECP
ncbi:MAG: hypothetical protein WD266_05910 [Balneolales bacterium]